MTRRRTVAARASRALAVALALGCAGPRAELRPSGGDGVIVRVRAPGADAAELVGTMNGWRPQAMVRRGDALELTLPLEPGRYEYRVEIVAPGGRREVWPEGAERVPDGFGGENGVLRVP